MTNWIERAQEVIRKIREAEPSIGQDVPCETEKSPDTELPLLPKSVPAHYGDVESRSPGFLDTESRAQSPQAKADATHDWVSEPEALSCPAMPRGVRLIRWEPRTAPVAIDVCSVVIDLIRFIEDELRALDSRLNNPWTIHGGFTVPQMLDRLAQAGLEVELDPKGGANE